jgi:hypothetical protein
MSDLLETECACGKHRKEETSEPGPASEQELDFRDW